VVALYTRRSVMDKTDLEYDIAIVLMVLASLVIAYFAQLAISA